MTRDEKLSLMLDKKEYTAADLVTIVELLRDRKSTRLNSSHVT